MDEVELAPFDMIVELIGVEKAAALSLALGGRRIYVPRNPGPHHPLAAAIGEEAAQAVAAEFPSHRLDIPLTAGKRKMIVSLRNDQRLSIARIAQELRCTERHVYQVLADEKAQQPGLFD